MKPDEIFKMKKERRHENGSQLVLREVSIARQNYLGMITNGIAMPFTPHEDFVKIVEMYRQKSSSIEDFLENLNRYVLDHVVYEMANPRTGKYMRTAAEVYTERKGICSEIAFLMISLARVAGLDARYGVSRDSQYANFEHGIAVIKSGNHEVAIEPCGRFSHLNLGYHTVSDRSIEKKFEKWRSGHLNEHLYI